MKLTQHPAVANTKVLVTGMPGSGKTTLVAQLAEHYNLLWIDLEKGASTLTKLPTRWQERIDLVVLPDSASYPIGSDTLMKLFKAGKAAICHSHGKTDCGICTKAMKDTPVAGDLFDRIDFSKLTGNDIVVIDTVTQLSHSILSHVTRNEAVDYKPERDDWGSLRRLTEFFCSQFQAVSFNLVCIAHVIEAKMEDGRTKLVPSFGSAGMSAEFAKAFDHVVYCDTKNGKHVAGSSSTYSPAVQTKSRTDFCIEKLPVPSLLPLFTAPSSDSSMKVCGVDVVVKPEVTGAVLTTVPALAPAISAAAASTVQGERSGKQTLQEIQAQIAARKAAELNKH